jgi:hypothetical protein
MRRNIDVVHEAEIYNGKIENLGAQHHVQAIALLVANEDRIRQYKK